MKRLLIFAAAVSLTMTVISSQGQPAPLVSDPPSTTVTSTITRNQWRFDTLNVYGTLTNVNVTMRIIGFDKNKKLVTDSTDYTIQSQGTFHARLIDTNREIKFVKIVLYDKTASNSQSVLGWTLAQSIQAYGQPTGEPVNDSFENATYQFKANGYIIFLTYFIGKSSSVLYKQLTALDERVINLLLSSNAPDAEWVTVVTETNGDRMWTGKVGDRICYEARLWDSGKFLNIVTKEYFDALFAASRARFAARAEGGLGWTLEDSIQHYGQPISGPKYEGLHSSFYLFKAKVYEIGAHYFEGELSRIVFTQPDVFEEQLVDAMLSVNAPKATWGRPLNGEKGETTWFGSIEEGGSLQLHFLATLEGDGKTLVICTKEDYDRNMPD